MKKSFFLFALVGLLFSIQSCTKDNGVDNPDNLVAPSIPPTSLFTIPTQKFGIIGDKETPSTRSGKTNWVHAGLNVLAWNTVVFVNTAIPISAFGHAFNYDAVYIGDATFEWKYEYKSNPDQGSKTYDVSLTGKYIMDQQEVAWTMTVSEQGGFKDFVWYEGIVATNHTKGSFIINKDPQSPKAYMEILFSIEPSSEDVTIMFSNILNNDPAKGDYIEWKTMNNHDYDRGYNVFNKGSLLEIEANEGPDDGRVKHPSHFGDSAWHCWDTNHDDIEC